MARFIFKKRRWRIVALLAWSLFGLSGCALFQGPPVISPYDMQLRSDLSLTSATKRLEQRNQPIDTFVTQASVVMKARRLPGKIYFDSTLLYQAPDRLRLRGYRNHWQVLIFDYLQLGESILVYLKQEHQLYGGNMAALKSSDSALSRFDPVLALQLLLAENSMLDNIAKAGEVKWKETGGEYRLRLRLDGLTYVYRLRKADLLIRQVTVKAGWWKKIARARYFSYGLEGDIPYPKKLEFIYYPGSTKTEIEVRRAQFNPELMPSTFDPGNSIRGIPSVRPLEDLEFK